MIKTKQMPSKAFLEECFDYNPETGSFLWKERPRHHFPSKSTHASFNSRWPGTKAGTPNCRTGHISVNLSGKQWKVHRLIWKMCVGEPRAYLDHVDGNPQNNMLSNLRECTQAQNLCNRKKSDGRHSVYKGVTRNLRNKYKVWQAQIAHNGKNRSIGYFVDESEAAKAYDAEAKKLHGEFAKLNFPD